MGNYAIVDAKGIITNIIKCSASFAKLHNALPGYSGMLIGEAYIHPPEPLTEIELLKQENRFLKAQVQAQSDRTDFLEDCIAEMAMEVYGGV